jgi:hypothetical protein
MHKILFYNNIIIIIIIYASTCFEQYVLIIRKSKLCYTASGIITPVHGTATYRCDDGKGKPGEKCIKEASG